MTKKQMLKWVRALRSGKYEQGTGVLNYNNESYCCLGVLCEVNKEKKTLDGKTYYYDGQFSTLSYNLGDKYGINRATQVALARKNDAYSSFEDIASYIEQNYKFFNEE